MIEHKHNGCIGCKHLTAEGTLGPCVYCKGTAWPCSAEYENRLDYWEPTSTEPKKPDAVNHPAHYQGKHECIDEMVALFGVEAVKSFCRCNVYKYRFRAAAKNGQEDLDKAAWYMDKLIELEGAGGNDTV